MGNKLAYISLIGLILIFSFSGSLFAAEGYKIGPGDLLEIRFWQDATLNADVRVGQDNMISLDIVGQIEAAGKTTTQLQNDIVNQMSRLNARISQVIVRVIDYQYQYVFVKGQVVGVETPEPKAPGQHQEQAPGQQKEQFLALVVRGSLHRGVAL